MTNREPLLRRALGLAAFFNVGGAMLFLFPSLPPGPWLGVPGTAPILFRSFVALFVLLLAGAYAYLARARPLNRAFVAFGAIGKASAFALALALFLLGKLGGPAVVLFGGDLLFAGAFAWGLAGGPGGLRRQLSVMLYRLKPYRRWVASAASMDDEYRGGRWDFLRGLGESVRHGGIAGYIRRLAPGGTVLDVSCGEGTLHAHLTGACSSYLGVDLSDEAIRRARAAVTDAQASFVAADATTFVPPGRYDVIVFNECLYYFDDPVAVVDRYRGNHLNPGGVLIVSLYRETTSLRIWDALTRRFTPLEEARITNKFGTEWTVKVFAS